MRLRPCCRDGGGAGRRQAPGDHLLRRGPGSGSDPQGAEVRSRRHPRPDGHRQDAGGHRVEGAGVTALPLLEDPTHCLDRVEGGDPRGLVDDQHPRRHDNTAASASSTLFFTSTKVPGTVHPAALRCPPPPNRAATAETSTRPLERKLTRKTSPSSSRREKATSTPTMERG